MDKLTYKLRDLGEYKNGANYPKGSYGEGDKIVNVKDLFRGRYVSFDGLDELKPNALKNKKIYLVEDGDLLFTRSSLVKSGAGMVAMIKDPKEDVLFCGFIIRYRPNKSKVYPLYLLYLLRSPNYRKLFTDGSAQTNISNINQDTLGNIEVELPSVDDQKKIVEIIDLCDKKIELNQHINAELESMAKTLYYYWFVQFNFPDENGKPYKTNGGKMVWNEVLKRDIPQGWEVKKIGEVLKIVRGASPRPIDDYLSTEGMPWVKISDATATDNRFITQTKQFIIKEGVSKSRLLQPDTLILSNSASPAIPRITKIQVCVHDGWLIIDDYTHGLTKEFMLHFFEQERPRILNMGTGSIFKNLKTEYIKDLNILIPPAPLLEMAAPQLRTISETIYARTKESQTLTELRDWLLPMLMNGQVKV